MYITQNWVFQIFNEINFRFNMLCKYNLIRNVVL